MSRHPPRWPAGIGAFVCAGFVLFALFRDVRQLTDIGASQGGIIVAMTVAIASGFYFANSHTILERTLFGLLFAIATFISVGLGGGRTNAMLEEKVAQVSHASTALSDHKARLEEIKADRDDAREKLPPLEQTLAAAQKEQKLQCRRKRNEERCNGATTALETAVSALSTAQERRDRLDKQYDDLSTQVIDTAPPPKANAELNSMTKLLALFVSPARAEELIRLVWPFLLATVGELGTIAFVHKLTERRAPEPITIPPAQVKPRRADPEATVTAKAIADSLGVTDRHVRKLIKKFKIEVPEGGHRYTPSEAQAIKNRILLEKGSTHVSN